MQIQSTTAAAGQRLREAVRPFLPAQTQVSGVPVAQLASACDAYISNPAGAPSPYPADLPVAQAVSVSGNLKTLAEGAQADFAAQVPQGQLTVAQLRGSLENLKAGKETEIPQLQGQCKALRSAYFKQVGKTCGWMGATAGALVLGGMLPNPVTGLVLAGVATLTVRSINHARVAHQVLTTQLPPLQANLKASQQVLADTVFYAPHLQAWQDLLSAPSGARAA